MKIMKKVAVIVMAAISMLMGMSLFMGCDNKDEKNYTINDLFNKEALCFGFTTRTGIPDVDYMQDVTDFTNKDMPIVLNDSKQTPIENLVSGSYIILYPTPKATEVTITKISYTMYRAMRNDEQDTSKITDIYYFLKNGSTSSNSYLKEIRQELNTNNANILLKDGYKLWTYEVEFNTNIRFEQESKTKDGFNSNSTWQGTIDDAVSCIQIRPAYFTSIANLKIEFTYNK